MDKLLADYKAYYRARAKRYEGHRRFKRLAQAEKNLSDAMEKCTDLNTPNPEVKHLAEQTAVAQTIDMSEYRYEVYTELKEIVQAKGNKDLITYYSANPDIEPMAMVRASAEILVNNVKEISQDILIVSHFMNFRDRLEYIEVLQHSEAIPKYEAEMKSAAAKHKEELKERMKSDLAEGKKYHPDYEYRWELLWEERHRRLIPIPDEILTKRINELKAILP